MTTSDNHSSLARRVAKLEAVVRELVKSNNLEQEILPDIYHCTCGKPWRSHATLLSTCEKLRKARAALSKIESGTLDASTTYSDIRAMCKRALNSTK